MEKKSIGYPDIQRSVMDMVQSGRLRQALKKSYWSEAEIEYLIKFFMEGVKQ